MEIYFVVPDDLNKTHFVFETCGQIFSRQAEKVFLFSNFNEKCIGVALEIAKNIGCSFKVDMYLNSEGTATVDFPKRHYWPNHQIYVLVVQGHIAHAIAKIFDPDSIKSRMPAIPTDVLFRLKDIFPEEYHGDEIDSAPDEN